MIEYASIGVLLAIVLIQQYSIQKLVNKLMCRNLHEYVTANGLKTRPMSNGKTDHGAVEDMGVLGEFS